MTLLSCPTVFGVHHMNLLDSCLLLVLFDRTQRPKDPASAAQQRENQSQPAEGCRQDSAGTTAEGHEHRALLLNRSLWFCIAWM